MISINDIKDLVQVVEKSNILEFVVECDSCKLSIKKSKNEVDRNSFPAEYNQTRPDTVFIQHGISTVVESASNGADTVPPDELYSIKSPMIGKFYTRPTPDSPPFVCVGHKIKEGAVVCLIETMKMFTEIQSEVDGTILEILVEDEKLVEFGQPLYLIKRTVER